MGTILDSKAFAAAKEKLNKDGEARKSFEGAPSEWLAQNDARLPKGFTLKGRAQADFIIIIVIWPVAGSRHYAELHLRL